MVRRLVDAAKRRGENGEGLRTIIYGGGPMYLADIRDAISTMGQRFVQIYGQGESPMTITALSRDWHRRTGHPRYLERLSSVGTAQSVMRVRITDKDGNPLPAGETGEVEAKGAAVMLGYWNNPTANAETLKDGWLRTGDVGRLDEDGFLTLSDRSKDVIISGGTNIYPREVEEALLTHPDVREVSAIGMGPVFLNTNRSKRSICLDLKKPAGRDAVLRLIRTADVLVYNVRPQAMARLQLGYDVVSKINPRLVYAGVFGFGQDGPYAAKPAYDDLIQGATALPALMAQTSADGVPRYVPNALVDRIVGLTAVGAICASLVHRDRTGQGQRVDIPMFETMDRFRLR